MKRQDLAEQMSRAKPKAKKSYDDLENFKKNMRDKKLTYSVEDIQKRIDEIDRKVEMSRIKPKAKKSYEDLENFKKNMSNKKLTYSVEDIQKKIDDIDRKVGTGAKEEQK